MEGNYVSCIRMTAICSNDGTQRNCNIELIVVNIDITPLGTISIDDAIKLLSFLRVGNFLYL